MAAKPGRVVTNNKDLPSIKSHPYYMAQLVILISFVQFVGLECKLLSRHRLLVCIILII